MNTDEISSKAEAGVVCRNCGLNHRTLLCPFKGQIINPNEFIQLSTPAEPEKEKPKEEKEPARRKLSTHT